MQSLSPQLISSLVEHATDGVLICNIKGEIIYCNKASSTIFGINKVNMFGKNIEMLMPERFRTNHFTYMSSFFENPSDRRMGMGRDLFGIRATGEEFPLEISLSLYNDVNEKYLFAFVVDISARKKIENELIEKNIRLQELTDQMTKLTTELETKVHERTLILREALEELENSQKELAEALSKEKELSEIKSRFVSMASHEFRTPLSTILSSASLISKYTETDGQSNRERHIKKIKEAVNQLNEILEDFLSIGKLEDGRLGINNNRFELLEFFNEIIEEVKPILKLGQSIDLIIKGNTYFITDKRILKNILINLLSNATKFSYENQQIHLFVDSEINLKIQVKDYGIGIAKEDIPELFANFYRAKNAVNIQGTGLGLPIIKRYLNMIKGEIEIESVLNEGTTVEIEIPLATENTEVL